MGIQYIHVEYSYDFLLFMLKIEAMTRGTNSMPFLVFRRDHLRPRSGIICGSGSFAVQFGDHFRSGDHLPSGIICGAVQLYKGERASASFYLARNFFSSVRSCKSFYLLYRFPLRCSLSECFSFEFYLRGDRFGNCAVLPMSKM